MPVVSNGELRGEGTYKGGTPPSRLRTRPCVTGPLKLKTLQPVQRDLGIFGNALAETGASEGFFCITAPAWTEEFVWNEIHRPVVDAGLILQIDDLAISHDWDEVRRTLGIEPPED